MKSFVAALALAVLPFSAATAQQVWNFSYDAGTGVLTGQLNGTLQGDSNSILINSLLSAAWNGTPGVPLTYLNSLPGHDGGFAGNPLTTLDGSFQDWIACNNSNCNDGFVLTTGDFLGPAFNSGVTYGQLFVPYNRAAWSISAATGAVPEPESWALLIAGFGLVGAVARRRRTAVAA